MKEIKYLYHFIDKANKSQINLNNYNRYKEKNYSFFSLYLKKFLIRRCKTQIVKSYVLKSYTTLIREINSTNQIFPFMPIFFLRIITFFRLTYFILNSLNFTIKSSLIIDSSKLKKKDLYICFNFPKYSFNKSKNLKSSFFNSISSELQNIQLISVNGYSKKNDNQISNSSVTFLSTKFSIKNSFLIFFLALRKTLKYLLFKKISSEILMISFADNIKAEYYRFICNEFEKKYNVSIKKIFFLCFENPFYFNEKLNNTEIKEFFYADNIFVPPINNINENINYNKIISPNLWSLTNHHYGLVDNLNKIENYKKNFLKLETTIKNSNEISNKCLLGFKVNRFQLPNDEYYLVFDTPPIDIRNKVRFYKSIRSNLFYDYIESEEYCVNFLNDFQDIQSNTKKKIFIKPKYQITYYPKNYRNLLNFFEKENLLMDPYEEISQIIDKASKIFLSPFTSVNRIFEKNNCYFYSPQKYEPLFYKEKSLIIGKDNLKFLINEHNSIR